MTENLPETYETINSLQLQGNYEELSQIVEYATAAIQNDGEQIRGNIHGIENYSSKAF